VTEALIIETAELRKTYDDVEALRGLTMAVPRGSICGFLGRNGAGKTTAMKILLGMTHATSGSARVFDLPPDNLEIRRRTAFVSEEKDLYPYMTVEEVIHFTRSFFGPWRADLEEKYLRAFELPPQSTIKSLSLGTRTKLALLLALCRGAELLILDEATSGLDPAMAEEVLQLLVTHAGSGESTIFFSSHQIAEIEQIADRVVIIDKGRAVIAGVLDDLHEKFRRIQLVFEGEAPEVTFHSPGVARVARKGRVLTILSSAGADSILDEARNLNPVSTDVAPVSLKEIFLETVNG
jgi:ABC-type multidrug transport system ATPase subunit